MSNWFVVSMDTGNGELKIVSDAVTRLVVGGVLGEYKDPSDGKTKVSRSSDDVTVYQVESESTKWVIGYDDVQRQKAKPHSVVARDGLIRYSQDMFKRYVKVGLAKAIGNKRPPQILLLTSTPANDYLDKDILTKLDDLFRDVHKVRQDDERLVLNVARYESMSETEAVLYDLYLDTEAGVADDLVESQDILVINAGFGTTDLSFYSNLDYIKLDNETIKHSYLDVIKGCREYLKAATKKNITEEEIAIQLSNQYDSSRKIFTYVSDEYDFTDVYKEQVDKVFGFIQTELNKNVEDPDRYHRIVVVGGGAEVWSEHFKRWSRRVQIPEDPQFAAARGMWKYGQYVLSEMEELNDEEIAVVKD